MQPEPTDVSQRTPSVDSSTVEPTPTQHGNDFADGPVPGPLTREATGGSALLDQPTPGPDNPPLNDAVAAPPSSPASRVVQHENAGTQSRRGPELGFRAVASSAVQSKQFLESLPNGMLSEVPRRSAPINKSMQRFSPIFSRTCLLSRFRP